MKTAAFELQRFAIYGTSGNDNLTNTVDSNQVYGYAGDDLIYNYGKNSTLDGGADNDDIYNAAGGVKILGGAGNDSIRSSTGKDYTINSSYGYVTIDGGAGNDTIDNYDPHVSISGGAGADSIYLSNYSGLTVNGGTGNDTINSHSTNGVIYQYAEGDGSDYISGYNENDTISIRGGAARFATFSSGDDAVVSVIGSGAITLAGAADTSLKVIGGAQVISTTNTVTNAVIYGTALNDTIRNNAGGAKIFAGYGDDYIHNSTGSDYTINSGYGYVTLDGGYGDDSIYSYDPRVSISGGSGNDLISLRGSGYAGITVNGGVGNDTIYAPNSTEGILYQYQNGNGFDLISGYSSEDTISIGGSPYYVRSTVGSDVVLDIASGLGAITLVGASDKTINIKGGRATVPSYISNSTKNTVLNGTNFNDTIRNFAGGVKIYGGAGSDSLFTSTSSSYTINSSWGYVTIDGGVGDDTIIAYDPNVSIFGNAGNDWISLGGSYSNVTIRGGFGSDSIYANGYSNIYQYASGDGSDYISGYDYRDTISLASGLSYSTMTSGDNILIYVPSSGTITLDGASGTTLNITGGSRYADIYNTTKNTILYGTANADTILNRAGGVRIYGYADDDYISSSVVQSYTVSSSYGNVTIDAGSGNDTIYSNDPKVLIDGGIGNDSISLGSASKNVTIIASGGNDTIYGYDSSDTISIAGVAKYTTLKSGTSAVVSIQNYNSITLDGAASKTLNFTGGNYILNAENYTKNISVTGTANNDTIKNYAGGVKIFGNDGNDSIYNSTNSSYTINSAFGYVTIDGGDGDDTITNVDPNVSIRGGAGADWISLGSYATNNTINASFGNDTIAMASHSSGNVIEYYGGNGLDTVYGYTAKDSLFMITSQFTTVEGSGNDVIVTLMSGGGMTLLNARGKTLNFLTANNVSGTTGENFSVTSANATVTGTQNADTISNYSGGAVIRAGKGNDTIYSSTNANHTINGAYGYVTIDGGEGNDSIYSNDPNVSIAGGDGDDRITLESYSKNVTVYGGAGNDSISITSGTSAVLQFSPATGNNVVTGVNADDTIHLLSGSISSAVAEGDDVILTIATSGITGKVTLKGTANQEFKIKTLSGAAQSTLIAGIPAGIKVSGTTLTASSVFSGSEIDLSEPYASGVTKVNATALSQNVTIVGSPAADSIKSGKGNDTIFGGDGNNTIYGGAGNDLIYGGVNADKLFGEAGNDTIYGSSGNDTVSLGAGSDVYVYSAGNDLIQDYAAGQDKIRLSGASITGASLSSSNVILTTNKGNITVKGGKDKKITVIDASGNETTNVYPISTLPGGISVSGATLTASSAFSGNEIDLADYASTVTKVNASAVSQNVTIKGNAAANSIKGGKGSDNIHSGAGNDTVYGGAGNDWIYGEDGNDKLFGEAGNDTIFGGYGNDTVSLGAGSDVYVYGGGSDLIQDYVAGEDKIRLSSATITGASLSSSNVILTTSEGNITVKGGKGKALTIINSSGVESTNVYPINTLPAGISVSGAVLTASSVFSGSSIVMKDYGVTKVNASAVTQGVEIIGAFAANSIKGGKGADTIDGAYAADTLYGGAGNDLIYGYEGNDKLFGEAGNDTIFGGGGNDTVSLGAGSDVYVYSGGNDLIQDYAAGQDKIVMDNMNGPTITGASVSGSNVILTTNNGNITVKGGNGKALTIIDIDGNETTNVYPILDLPAGISVSGAVLTASSVFSGDKIDLADYPSTVTKVNATALTQNVSIIGSAAANSMKGGKGADFIDGGAGNDTLYGGAGNDMIGSSAGNNKLFGEAGNDSLVGGTGNDTLSGGAGSDVFLYFSGGGNDVVTDYTAGADKIQLVSGKISGVSYSDTDVIFAIGSGSLTVKKGSGKKITITDADGVTTTETYSGSNGNAAVPWFAEDDTNFVGSGANLSDITAENYSVTNLETDSSFENLAQSNFLTLTTNN